jgi:CHASE3 domain sensor protein
LSPQHNSEFSGRLFANLKVAMNNNSQNKGAVLIILALFCSVAVAVCSGIGVLGYLGISSYNQSSTDSANAQQQAEAERLAIALEQQQRASEASGNRLQ